MTQTIEQLQARVAELETQCSDYRNDAADFHSQVNRLTKQSSDLVDLNNNLTSHRDELIAQVAELEAENARMKEIEQTNDTLLDRLGDKNAALLDEVASQKHCYAEAVAHYEKQLLSAQAEIKRLRDALQTYIDEHEECQDADDWMAMMCSMEAHHVADEALAQPSDTSALDAYVAEKVKEAMK